MVIVIKMVTVIVTSIPGTSLQMDLHIGRATSSAEVA